MQRSFRQEVVVPVVYIAAMFMSVLDTTVVTVALPTIAREFHAGTGQVALVSTAYLVSLAVFIPAAGWLGDRFGGRTALLGAVAVFTIASVLCGVAGNLAELVIFRVLQGAGGAVMVPVGLAMLFRVFPPAERVRVSSIVAVFVALGPALGPVLGGLLTTYASWRWVFFVNVPAGVAAIVFGVVGLEAHEQPAPGRLDVVGFVLSGAGLAGLIYGVSTGPGDGWTTPAVLVTVILGVVLLVALVVVELRRNAPLVDLRLFGNRLFAATTSLYGLASVTYIGVLYLVALFFQNALHLSAVASGLTSFPSALGVLAGGQLVTRVFYRRIGPRRLVIAGLLIMGTATALLALVGTGTDLWLVRGLLLVLGLGVGFAFVPTQAASMATVDRAATGRAASLFNAAKQVGSAVGVALLGTVLAVASPETERAAVGAPHGYHVAFLVAAGIVVAAIAVALTLRDADAESTRRPTPARSHGRPDPLTPSHR